MSTILIDVVDQAATLTNPTVETSFSTVTGLRLILAPSNLGSFHGSIIQLTASMTVTGGTTTNFTPILRWNSRANLDLTTFTGDTTLKSMGAVAVNSVTRTAFFQERFVWDAITQRLVGFHASGNIFGTSVAASAFASSVTGVIDTTQLQFFLTGLFSVSNGSNVARLTSFYLEQF